MTEKSWTAHGYEPPIVPTAEAVFLHGKKALIDQVLGEIHKTMRLGLGVDGLVLVTDGREVWRRIPNTYGSMTDIMVLRCDLADLKHQIERLEYCLAMTMEA